MSLFIRQTRGHSAALLRISGEPNLEADFTGFEAIIDRVGDIDIELTSAETAYINKRNHTSIVADLNNLNGAEALT